VTESLAPHTPSRFGVPLRIGEWIADPTLDEIRKGSQIVKLEPRKMQLLLALALRPGQLVTTEELFEAVWKNVIVTPSSIYQTVAQLRKTLGDDADEPRYIATVPRKGYRLVADVAPVVPKEAASPAQAPISIAASGGDAVVRIAVLPFVDLSRGGIEGPLAQGLADHVIGELSRHPQIRVAAHGSALQVRDSNLAEIGTQLNVTHVLSGELYRTRERVRVTARLMRVGESAPLWLEAIERPIDELASVSPVLTNGALKALRLPTHGNASTASAEAYELTLLGRHALRPMTPEAILKARDYFQRAIDVDATYAPAYVELGLTWILQAKFGSTLYPRDAAARAQPLFDKALVLAPDLPEAHAANGFLGSMMLQPDAARKHLQRALELQPGSAQTWTWLGSAAAEGGHVIEALAHYARATELDPLNFILQGLRGDAAMHAGRYEEAQMHQARALQLAPDHPDSRIGAGLVGYARGRLDEAVDGFRRALEADSRRRALWFEIGWIYMDLGLAPEADAAFAQGGALSKVAAYGPLNAAYVLFLTGRSEEIPEFFRRHDLPSGQYGHVEINCALQFAAIGRAHEARGWLERGLAQLRSDPMPAYSSWDAFRGYLPIVDIAAIYSVLGEPAAAQPFMDQAHAHLTAYESRGNVWHSARYGRARLEAIGGQEGQALELLDQAIEMGWRRAWWARFDPAWISLRGAPRFVSALERVESEVAKQRARVIASA
jgi:DNA-binding winged helix-turn-helix (wHTH) protein/tetratricopeptide (TPR) repeat protein